MPLNRAKQTLHNQRGQILTAMMLMMPLFILALVMVIDYGVLTHRRLRIQAATDLAAHAGASVMAQKLTEISNAMSDLQAQYEEALRDSKKVHFGATIAGSNKVAHEYFTNKFWDALFEANETGYAVAVDTAQQVFQQNIDWSPPDQRHCIPYYSGLGRWGRLLPIEDKQTEKLNMDYTTGGGGPLDPSTHKTKVATVVRPSVINHDRNGDWAPNGSDQSRLAFVCQGITLLNYTFMSGRLGEAFFNLGAAAQNQNIRAVAAAQPYGGTLLVTEKNGQFIPAGDPRKTHSASLISIYNMIMDVEHYLPLVRIARNGNQFYPQTNEPLLKSNEAIPLY